MNISQCVESLSMPLPEDILKRKWAGDLEDAVKAIDCQLQEELPDMLRALPEPPTEIEFVGVCTGICVISNAMLCKAAFPEANIVIDAALCACVTPESHDTALNAMRLCQMEILHQGEEPWRK